MGMTREAADLARCRVPIQHEEGLLLRVPFYEDAVFA